ncbi:MAG: hypothetical protein WC906_03115 [Parcubacteria group bacterium]|jgi:hypothetical protein
MKKIKGCVHLIVRNGKIEKVITHLSELPKNGIVHLKGDKTYSFTEFKKSHPNDDEELKMKKKGIIISDF